MGGELDGQYEEGLSNGVPAYCAGTQCLSWSGRIALSSTEFSLKSMNDGPCSAAIPRFVTFVLSVFCPSILS